MMWSGTTVPALHVRADGTGLAESSYPELVSYAATEIAAGNALWSISGITPNRTVTVPNLGSKFVYGSGVLGASGGAATHQLITSEMPAHNHGAVGNHNHGAISYAGGGGGADVATWTVGGASAAQNANFAYTGYSGGHTHATEGSNYSHNNMPPYITLAYIIRAKTS